MTFTYEAKMYSQGRTTVMGIATIMILWFHTWVAVEEGSLFQFIKNMCDIGVDMFLFASGVGIYSSLQKHQSYRSYLFGRLMRILPAFFCVTIPWFAYMDLELGGRNITAFLMNVSTLSFWFQDDLTCWYVASILCLYVITPAYVRLWKKSERLNGIMIAVFYASLLLIPSDALDAIFGGKMLIVRRLPVYLMGLSLGKAIKEERVFRISTPGAIAVVAVCIFVLASVMGRTPISLPGTYKYHVYGPLVVAMSFLFAGIPANPVFNFFGKHSLEIYLLYEKIQALLADQSWMWPIMKASSVGYPLITLGITLIGAFLLGWVGKAVRWLLSKTLALDKTAASS